MRLQRAGRIPNTVREDVLRKLLRDLENPLIDKVQARHMLSQECAAYADYYEPYEWTEEQYAALAVKLREGAKLLTTINFSGDENEEVQLLYLGDYTIFIKDNEGDEGVVSIEQVDPKTIREVT